MLEKEIFMNESLAKSPSLLKTLKSWLEKIDLKKMAKLTSCWNPMFLTEEFQQDIFVRFWHHIIIYFYESKSIHTNWPTVSAREGGLRCMNTLSWTWHHSVVFPVQECPSFSLFDLTSPSLSNSSSAQSTSLFTGLLQAIYTAEIRGQSLPSPCSIAMFCKRRLEITNFPTITPMESFFRLH